MFQQSELRELEDKCIQEHAPTCMAACPIHVDVRAVVAEINRGDFAAALKALKKSLPFPGIIGRVCDHPCQAVCKRLEVGETIAIAALEQACADFGGPPEKARVLPKRGKRVAVVGGGLSGLTAAFDLARKGYTVVVYEAGEQLGGRLWHFTEQALPRAILRAELSQVEAVGAEIRLQAPVAPEALAGLRNEFDVVYLVFGATSDGALGLEQDEFGRIRADPLTYATSQNGVFAGGSLLRTPEAYSPIQSISDGRRAAISIDRYLQKVSLTASRINEGAYVTRLYTNTEGISPLNQVRAANPPQGYTREEAIHEAGRCLLCECMECVKVCEYLRHYRRYPKKYVREIYNNLSIVKGERKANTFINSCSLCGLCGQVCPNDLNMGAVNKQARQIMVEQNRMPPSAHDFALRDLAFSNSDRFRLARHRPGALISDFVFFPGCQLAGSSPEYVEKTYAYLQAKLGHADLAAALDNAKGLAADLKGADGALGRLLVGKESYETVSATLKEGRDVAQKLNKGEGTLGRLLNDAVVYNDLKKTMDTLSQVAADISEGRGTLGKLVKDTGLHDTAQKVLGQISQAIEDAREQAPISAFTGALIGGFR